jgi:thioredoxin-like negative regulator of GroEL
MRLIEGEAALARGFASEALARFQEAQKLANAWLVRYALARTYLSLGAYAEASSELEVVLKRRGEAAAAFLDDVPTLRYLPPALYDMARAQEGLRSPAARQTFTEFLAIKKDAADGDPLVADARRRLAALK